MSCATALLAIALASTPSELEARAARHVLLEFERVGRTAPAADPSLAKAARALAARTLATTAAEAADLLVLSQAVSDAGGFDPIPRALVVRGSPHEEPLKSLLGRTDLPSEPATHAGVGAAVNGNAAAIVVLLTQRKAELSPFPRTLPAPGAVKKLCAQLASHLRTAELYVTRPSGGVERLPAPAPAEGRVCAWLPFPTVGQHTVELIVRGDRGPEVAAMFFVQVGAPSAKGARTVFTEPTTPEAARAAIVERVNGLRRGNGLPEVEADAALDAVAQAYSDQLARENFFAHVAPDGTDLRARLTRAGYRYQSAGENLGLAAGPLAAHFGIEHSPGHRKNLLDDGYTRIGVGVTFKRLEDRTQVLVTEVLAAPAGGGEDAGLPGPLDAAYAALAKGRAALKLTTLRRNGALEEVAGEHLRRALELDEPKTRLPGFSTSERVFAALDDVGSASVDLFIAESPALVSDSKNLADPRNDRVGVAVKRTDSAKYGKDHFWVVVIYASPR